MPKSSALGVHRASVTSQRTLGFCVVLFVLAGGALFTHRKMGLFPTRTADRLPGVQAWCSCLPFGHVLSN